MTARSWLAKDGKKSSTSILGMIMFLLSWQVASKFIASPFMPDAVSILSAVSSLLSSGELSSSIVYSVANVTASIMIISAMMLFLASVCFVFPDVGHLLDSVINSLRAISPIAIFPIFILSLGIGRESQVAVIMWACWGGLFVSMLNALKKVDRQVIEAAEMDGASPLQIVYKIAIPVSSPYLMNSLNVAVGWGWLAMIASEMIGGFQGLGFYILSYSQAFRYSEMYATIIIVGLCSTAMSSIVTIASKLISFEEIK